MYIAGMNLYAAALYLITLGTTPEVFQVIDVILAFNR